MDRNYLKGTDGDKMNAILAGCGFNFRRLLRAFIWLLFKELERLGTLIFLSPFVQRSAVRRFANVGLHMNLQSSAT
jgi:IS5 family transposase